MYILPKNWFWFLLPIFIPGKWFVTSNWFLEGFWQSVTCGCRKRRRGGRGVEEEVEEEEEEEEVEEEVGGRKEGREQHDNCDTRAIQSAAIAF